MIFHDSDKNYFFQNKAEFKILSDSEVFGNDFSGLRTPVTSMTSTASTTSMASKTSTAAFHQNIYSGR
jgi:hypothetical protein